MNITHKTITILIAIATWACAGSLEPTTPPTAGTMKTLDQIEARIPVQSLPSSSSSEYVISEAGSYYLTGNITSTINNKHIITVNASNVTLDLNGFTISRGITMLEQNYDGIHIPCDYDNVKISNGAIICTNTESNRGLRYGIYADYQSSTVTSADNITVSGVTVKFIKFHGIYLSGSDNMIENCVAENCTGKGIYATYRSRITGCHSANNDSIGIEAGNGSIVKDNFSYGSKLDTGIRCYDNCIVEGNTSNNNKLAGIQCGDYGVIQKNTCSNNSYRGIFTNTACSVIGNICSTNGNYGIWCHSGCTVRDNTSSGNLSSGGIFCYSKCTIVNNTTYNNTGFGIGSNHHCQIRNNTCSDNTGDEIYMGSGGVIADNYTYN